MCAKSYKEVQEVKEDCSGINDMVCRAADAGGSEMITEEMTFNLRSKMCRS